MGLSESMALDQNGSSNSFEIRKFLEYMIFKYLHSILVWT